MFVLVRQARTNRRVCAVTIPQMNWQRRALNDAGQETISQEYASVQNRQQNKFTYEQTECMLCYLQTYEYALSVDV